jgi:Uma2 family endonuclease
MAPPVATHLTYRDLLRMPEDGPRYELIDGEAYIIPGPDADHQRAILKLAILVGQAIQDRSEVFIAPLDVVLSDDTVLQPDVLLIRPEGRARIKRSVEGPPDLVVEVLSPTSRWRDRGIKRATYARFGVSEYWLVDPTRRSIEVYRLVAGDPPAFRLERRHLEGDILTTPLLPALALDPAQLFPSPA